MEGLVNNKEKCCGCGLCAIKCPKKAITIKEDEYGFKYPYIDKEKCINCGSCKRICEYNKDIITTQYNKKAYAAFSKDENILNTTASGGIFTSIAESFINDGGCVYGCTLEKNSDKFIVKHIKISDVEDLEKIKGSKYVQSDITSIFIQIKNDLEKNKKVLFSGTPCQVATIKGFLHNHPNLFTIDIICHGVPNSKMFNDYINYINKKENIKIEDFKFRDKKKGWGLYYYYYYLDKKNNKYKKNTLPAFKSSYYQLFLDSFIYRENCYKCPYANDKRVGDITIGDYWGIEIEHSNLINKHNLNPEKGVSCIIVNSTKGEELVNNYSNKIELFKSSFDKIKKHNNQLNHPSKKNDNREKLLNDYKNDGYKSFENYYKRKNSIKNFLKKIWYKIPYKVRKKIRK